MIYCHKENLISSHRLQFSRYHKSLLTLILICSGLAISFPCIHLSGPTLVMPGFKTALPYNHLQPANNLLYALACAVLGPTRLISPLKTLMNCGNSSILVFLINLPIAVTRESFFVACLISASLLDRILLNFRQ